MSACLSLPIVISECKAQATVHHHSLSVALQAQEEKALKDQEQAQKLAEKQKVRLRMGDLSFHLAAFRRPGSRPKRRLYALGLFSAGSILKDESRPRI